MAPRQYLQVAEYFAAVVERPASYWLELPAEQQLNYQMVFQAELWCRSACHRLESAIEQTARFATAVLVVIPRLLRQTIQTGIAPDMLLFGAVSNNSKFSLHFHILLGTHEDQLF
jgi:hypothetical protein